MGTVAKLNDSVLWHRVCRDDSQAFEELVKRHQSAVCAVAYNVCGDLSSSEDVSQETFLTAWRDRLTLRDASRLKAWFCGIARNLARNSLRRTAKLPKSLDALDEPATTDPEPHEAAVTREEELMLWQALGQVDEAYREPLVLFYREDQSVAEVAAALDITTDAAKQRLSRGRAQLRDQIAVMVESALSRSRPNKAFTLAVMTGLGAMASSSKAAFIGATVAAVKSTSVDLGVAAVSKTTSTVVTGTLSSGIVGSVAGSAVGLFGGWLGTWLPAQLAPTKTQRDYQLKVGFRILIVSIAWSLAFYLVMRSFAGNLSGVQLVAVILGWIALLNLYLAIEIWIVIRRAARIQQTVSPEADPNDSMLKQFMDKQISRYEGRVYRSHASLFGLPLIDINVGSEFDSDGGQRTRNRACGWIAIGDRADGVLLAIGGIARGTVALGGVTVGLISCGGVAVGLISLGGVAIGALAMGGLGLGGVAFGGLALGWQAIGGLAVAWDTACGGGAFAHHAAYGGAAFANDMAMGGAVQALHANDEVAKNYFETHWLVRAMNWYQGHIAYFTVAILCVSILPPIVMTRLMYRRK